MVNNDSVVRTNFFKYFHPKVGERDTEREGERDTERLMKVYLGFEPTTPA